MGNPKPAYLSLVTPGYVLTYHESGRPSGVVMSHADSCGDDDKWIIEYGDEPNTVAIKSVSSGKYVVGEPKHEGLVGTSDTKQMWLIEHDGDKVRPPGSYRLSMVGTPELFLRAWNSSDFKPGQTGWRVVMHKWSITHYGFMTWYFADAGSSSGLNHSKALEDREATLSQQEKDIEHLKKQLENRTAALDQKEEESAAGRKALDDREATLSKTEEDRRRTLEDREASLAKQEEQYTSKTRALEDRKTKWSKQEKDNRAALEDREAALIQKEKDNTTAQKALKTREAALAQKERDHAADWDKKMEELRRLQQTSTQPKKSTVNDSSSSGCGSKHYKPPRKINRKVVGLIYEP